MGALGAATRRTGAVKCSIISSASVAAISAPSPFRLQDSSTMTTRPVLATDAFTVRQSNGTSERGSITSMLTPSCSNVWAACRQRCIISSVPITVTSDPSRRTAALPIGTT